MPIESASEDLKYVRQAIERELLYREQHGKEGAQELRQALGQVKAAQTWLGKVKEIENG